MDVRQRGTIGVAGGDAGNSTSSLATSQRAMARRTISDGKRSGASSGSSLTWMIGICLVIVVIVFVSGAVDFTSSAESSDSSRSTVRRTKEQVDQDQKQIQTLQEENKSLKQQVSKLKKQNADKAAEVAAAAAIPTDQGELAKQLKRLREYKRRMHDMIQLISKRNLIYKYGPGPHIVEILLSFDPASNVADASKAPDDTETLLIELAPVDEMPATVFWFLEQVNATAFDGCSFHRNAGHVVQGGPAPNFETLAGQRPMQKFRETELDSVPFQEYSPQFPHVKYTLGYAGRPGGPDFYVSTVDNTRNHGPGGQGSYEEVGEADPCFAKVMAGYEHVVDRMHKSEVKPGDYHAMKHNIAIRRMRLLVAGDDDKVPQAQR